MVPLLCELVPLLLDTVPEVVDGLLYVPEDFSLPDDELPLLTAGLLDEDELLLFTAPVAGLLDDDALLPIVPLPVLLLVPVPLLFVLTLSLAPVVTFLLFATALSFRISVSCRGP